MLKTVVQNISYRLGVLRDTTFLASWFGGVVLFEVTHIWFAFRWSHVGGGGGEGGGHIML